nr:membrane protein [Wencheng Sm shrew coronavirus]
MSNSSENITLSVNELVQHLTNWSFSWNVILTVMIIVLQYGFIKYGRIVYALKMLVLWLLWPLVLALSIFNAIVSLRFSYVMFAFCIVLICVTFGLWLAYFVNSIKLYRRTHSPWSFDPSTNAVLCFSVLGRSHAIPVPTVPTGITLTLLSGQLNVEGIPICSGLNFHDMPEFISVAKPNVTILYEVRSRKGNTTTKTGWVYYVRSKHGDYSAYRSQPTLNNDDLILHLA